MSSLLAVIWDVDPVFFKLGPVAVRYYGLSWVLGLSIACWLFYKMMKREGYSEEMYDTAFWCGVLSTIIGSRLGHCLFYDFHYYITHPWELLYFWEGGMASHGAAVGLLVGLWIFSRKWKMPYIWSLDRIGVSVAIGGAIVRLGNLMNSEIYGSPTTLPWGFEFVRDPWWHEAIELGGSGGLPVHPTQIYEALAYFAIFLIMWWMYFKRDLALRRPGFMFGFFLIALFGVRIVIEMIKNPQVAFERGMALDMGQILSIPFVIAGIIIIWKAMRNPEVPLTKNKTRK